LGKRKKSFRKGGERGERRSFSLPSYNRRKKGRGSEVFFSPERERKKSKEGGGRERVVSIFTSKRPGKSLHVLRKKGKGANRDGKKEGKGKRELSPLPYLVGKREKESGFSTQCKRKVPEGGGEKKELSPTLSLKAPCTKKG